ncbi:uncharacterized protein LOC143633995 [Bidens hawaiensis]|uniref:uncharacterized protein LOC143633995 n=1 Tax=Bidens hawaiensis TaxID=980011 RepID=UPI00404A21A1
MRKSGKGKKKEADAIDEVEELLKLTQDDLLLKLTVNTSSHIKSKPKPTFNLAPESNSKAIDPDLDRRFEALRSKPNPNLNNNNNNNNNNNIGVDDLFARFDALKGPNATSSSVTTQMVDAEDEEDEVQKIINWAKDAARLDPSPPSDSEEDDSDTRKKKILI